MSDPMDFATLLGILLALLAAGVWVALSLMIMALVALVFFSNAPEGLVLTTTLWGYSHSWPLAALPLFILMGEILIRSRLSQDMFSGLAPWLGRTPGRLLHVNVLGCAIFAAVSGSSAATAATIGRMSVPELTKRGYPESLILGTLAGSATLGLLIPLLIILPMVEAVGIDPLWFGIYLVLVVEMSQITPPVGFNLFVIQGLTGINILCVAKAALPFFGLLLLGTRLIVVFPGIVT
ncbi:MAG: TRAP transporter large permease subunit, partial [Albidovulum sp.]